MKTSALVVQITAGLIFIQMITGGWYLLSGDSLGHFFTGLIVFFLAVASVVLALRAKPKHNAFRYSTIALLAFVVLAGFTSEKGTMFYHYVMALIVFGVVVTASYHSARWSREASSSSPVPQT
jgi:uncharacterized membrane protein YhaH (DUF805 family)